MARKKYIRRRIVKLPSVHEKFCAPQATDSLADILAAEQKRYKYVRFGITTDLKAEYDLRKQRDDIQWSSMKVYYSTPYTLEAEYFYVHTRDNENYIPNNKLHFPLDLFDEYEQFYVYVMVGRRRKAMSKKKFTFIDLFAGCGGLSEGFLQTGKFEGLAHVEWESPMINTLRQRLVDKWKHSEDDAKKRVIKFDVQKTEELIHGNWSEETKKLYEKENHKDVIENGLRGLVGEGDVDLIIGGPPCQAYSIAGRAQSPTGMKDDYRNYLFESFVKIVDEFQPKAFVFENVPGLLSACPGDTPVRERIYEAFKAIGYDIRTPDTLKNSVYCAEDFNVPQKRNRVIIIGTMHDSPYEFEEFYECLTEHKCKTQKTVRDAIEDLPKLLPMEQIVKIGRSNVSHHQIDGKEVDLHIPRYHGERDQRLFTEWLGNNMNKASQQEKMDIYTRITGHTSNHIKYRNLEWDKPSPTIVAHLHKDGYMFIHPDIDQLRTITIREAALLQSFPLDYKFVASNPYCYKMIGNAVPVNFAKGIAEAMYEVLISK